MIISVCTLPVGAVSGDWGLDELENAVPPAVEEYMRVSSPGDDAETIFAHIGEKVKAELRERISRELGFCTVLFAVVLLSSVAELSDLSGKSGQAVRLASVLSVAASAVTDLNAFSSLALEALRELSDYSRSLLPVMAATASFSGAVASSAAKCTATAFVMDLLLSFGSGFIAPAVCGYTALTVADAAVGNHALRSAASLMRTVCYFALTALATVFSLWLGFISSVSGTAEAAGVKATRTILLNGLPVVGKLMSDAATSLSAAAGLVRSSAGVFGLAVVLSLCAAPFVRLGCRYLAFRLSATLCRCCNNGSLSGLLDELSTAFAMLLALLGTGALCVFMAVWSLMRMVL